MEQALQSSRSITWQTQRQNPTPPDLRLLHYNDVYHIEYKPSPLLAKMYILTFIRSGSAEPVGGIARFQYLATHYRSGSEYERQPKLLTFFSGDAYNPSLESSVTKGSHMVPILNQLGTDAACVGVSMQS